jgi:cytochrome c-type biogenesis protein CcmF
MNETFIGENLMPGRIGHFFVITALVASALSLISFLNAMKSDTPEKKRGWMNFGSALFGLHAISVLVIFSSIFYICSHHLYEYMYAYKHASLELESKYLLACIWEGQEGSFLLWALWHALIGVFLLRNKETNFNETWKAPVMSIVSVANFFLMMMILGIYFFDIRIGNSPFTLTRNEIAAPIFSQPNYLSFIKDGMGLNVLLRNYWMVIHPPVLFLGFASLLIPFAFACSSLKNKAYTDWIKPSLPWVLFGGIVLGIGIMMGGKWAYESLSFGGYWAWDPVENASLVPWLFLIAGMHTMLIYRATGHSLHASYLFILLSFIFVLYSTFLTRTGILGDTSVHSFTEAGKAINVMIGIFVLSFTIPSLGLFFSRYKKIPSINKEESTDSREFWMFIGSLLFFLSGVFIILITSIPVYGKTPGLSRLIEMIHGGPLAMPEDPEFLYNKVMIMVAIIIGLLTAITQYLKYKSTPRPAFLKKIIYPTLVSAVVVAMVAVFYPFTYEKHGAGFLIAIYLAFFSSAYAVIANGWYMFSVTGNNLKKAGSSVSHVGFTLMIVGILISSSNKKVISDSKVNGIQVPTGNDPMTKKKEDPTENLTLIRDVPTRMSRYEVTYQKDSSGNEKGRKFYHLNFDEWDEKFETKKPAFSLEPDVYIMKDNNMSSNPDTKSFLHKDVFSYISYAINSEQNTDTAQFKVYDIGEGETAFYGNGYFTLNKIAQNPVTDKFNFKPTDLALMAELKFVTKDSFSFTSTPLIIADSMGVSQWIDTVYSQNLYVAFTGVSENRKIKIGIKEATGLIDFVTVKTFEFPWIVLVWLGLIIMALGMQLSLLHRVTWKNAYKWTSMVISSIILFYLFLLAN